MPAYKSAGLLIDAGYLAVWRHITRSHHSRPAYRAFGAAVMPVMAVNLMAFPVYRCNHKFHVVIPLLEKHILKSYFIFAVLIE